MKSALLDGIRQRPTTAIRLKHLDECVARMSAWRELRILEVGSLFGVSAKVLAKYGVVDCVDLWSFPGGLDRFLTAVEGLPVTAWRGSSTVILPTMLAQSYDLIYLDGDHRYPVVEQDCRQARRLITSGGVICGDDLERVLTTPALVEDAEAHCHEDCIDGYHPGVSLAVHRVFGTVGMQDGFWWWPV